jgi:hypothetical protein
MSKVLPNRRKIISTTPYKLPIGKTPQQKQAREEERIKVEEAEEEAEEEEERIAEQARAEQARSSLFTRLFGHIGSIYTRLRLPFMYCNPSTKKKSAMVGTRIFIEDGEKKQKLDEELGLFKSTSNELVSQKLLEISASPLFGIYHTTQFVDPSIKASYERISPYDYDIDVLSKLSEDSINFQKLIFSSIVDSFAGQDIADLMQEDFNGAVIINTVVNCHGGAPITSYSPVTMTCIELYRLNVVKYLMWQRGSFGLGTREENEEIHRIMSELFSKITSCRDLQDLRRQIDELIHSNLRLQQYGQEKFKLIKEAYDSHLFSSIPGYFNPVTEIKGDMSEFCRSFHFPPTFNPMQNLADKLFQVQDLSPEEKYAFLNNYIVYRTSNGTIIKLSQQIDLVFDKNGRNILCEQDQTIYNIFCMSDLLYSSAAAIIHVIDSSKKLTPEQKKYLIDQILSLFFDSSCNGGATFEVDGKMAIGGKTKNRKRKNKKSKKRKNKTKKRKNKK